MPLQEVPKTTAVTNKYPNVPEYAPFLGTIDPSEFDAFVDTLDVTTPQKDSMKTIARWESGSALTKVTEGTNPYNFQADQGAWGHITGVIGTTVFVDHMGNNRRFVVFDTWQNGTISIIWYVVNRGIFVGAGPDQDFDPANSVKDAADLYARYARAWVYGHSNALIDHNESDGFVQLYNKTSTLAV